MAKLKFIEEEQKAEKRRFFKLDQLDQFLVKTNQVFEDDKVFYKLQFIFRIDSRKSEEMRLELHNLIFMYEDRRIYLDSFDHIICGTCLEKWTLNCYKSEQNIKLKFIQD